MAIVNVNPPVLTDKQIARFWSSVDKSSGYGPKGDCWRWTKCTVGGHGNVGTFTNGQKRNYYAHRVAFYLTYGYWPTLLVCHTCDWPVCCNPEHLFVGTQADNLRDMAKKGRSARGEKQGRAKLNAAQVIEIRALVASGIRQNKVARRFGVTAGHVNMIIKKKTWLHI